MKKNQNYVHSNNFMSNLDKRDRRAVMEASRKTGIKVYFEDKAYDGNGLPLKDLIGVFATDPTQDHSDLWCEYNYLVYLAKRGRIRNAVRT